jgi:oxygen-dependent protoporphyrinogen oxidase
LPQLPSGFGFVVAKDELRYISAATFSSIKFPDRAVKDSVLIRCFLGGVGQEEILNKSTDQIVLGVLSDCRRLLGIPNPPKEVHAFRWMRANPQYTVGHESRVRQIHSQLAAYPGLWLAGASYHGVGIPDCIADGERWAQAAHAYLIGR